MTVVFKGIIDEWPHLHFIVLFPSVRKSAILYLSYYMNHYYKILIYYEFYTMDNCLNMVEDARNPAILLKGSSLVTVIIIPLPGGGAPEGSAN